MERSESTFWGGRFPTKNGARLFQIVDCNSLGVRRRLSARDCESPAVHLLAKLSFDPEFAQSFSDGVVNRRLSNRRPIAQAGDRL